MKSLNLLILLGLLAACMPAKKEAETTSGNINASSPYLWSDKNFPKLLEISRNFTANETTSITSMSTAWKTAVENKKTFFNHGPDKIDEITNTVFDMDSLLDDEMGIYKTTQWPISLPGSALAVTQIFGRRFNIGTNNEYVNIEHADILINYDYYPFDTDDFGNGYDLRTVLLHEMGHYLGLQHKSSATDRNNSVMYPSINASEAKRTPTNIDSADIASKYAITLGAGGGGAAVMGGNAVVYSPAAGDTGSSVKILIELHADGECVHRLDGNVVSRHQANIKKLKK